MMTHIILPDTGNIFFGEVNLSNDYDKALLKIGANLGGGMLITKRTGYENLCMRIAVFRCCNAEYRLDTLRFLFYGACQQIIPCIGHRMC